MKKKILILTYTNIAIDSIVNHQIRWLQDDYDVHVVCGTPDNSYNVKYHHYKRESFIKRNSTLPLLLLRLFKKYSWSKNHKELSKKLSDFDFNLIIGHHIRLLPIAFKIAKSQTKVLLFAHEYYPEAYTQSIIWRLFFKKYFHWLTSTYATKCHNLISVNESISKFYKNNYGIKGEFIHNAVDYEKIEPKKTDILNIRIIHHGLASPSRKIELMLEMMKYLDNRFSLSLLLITNSIINKLYINKLKRIAGKDKRIRFENPVPFSEIIPYSNTFDIGLFFMPPTTLNEEYSLGHKVFQYIQSRLLIAISPLPEMKKLVDKYDLGLYSNDYNPESLAKKLMNLTVEEIDYYKNRSNSCAKEVGAENNKSNFLTIISKLIG